MKKILFLLLLLCLSSAQAATTLRVGTWLPPTNPQNEIVWQTWAGWVEEATEGRVVVELEYGLGHPKTLFGLVEDGVVDAAFSVLGYLPGRFQLPMLAELPGVGDSAEANSVALWRTQQEYFAAANEFEGLSLLGLFVHGPAQIHTLKPVNSLADLSSMKIRIGGGIQGQIAERFNTTAVQAPATKVYEMMQQGVVDGVFLPVLDQKFLRLSELTRDITVVPNGLYASTFAMFANPEFLEDLDAKDREAILAVSGEKLSALAGKAWEEADQAGYAVAEEAGVQVHYLNEESALLSEITAALHGLEEAYLASVSESGVNATAALAYFREQVNAYQP